MKFDLVLCCRAGARAANSYDIVHLTGADQGHRRHSGAGVLSTVCAGVPGAVDEGGPRSHYPASPHLHWQLPHHP